MALESGQGSAAAGRILAVEGRGSTPVRGVRQLAKERLDVRGELVPGIVRRSLVDVVCDVHPADMLAKDRKLLVVPVGGGMQQRGAGEGRIVGVAAEVVAFEGGLVGEGAPFVNDDDVG